MGLPTSLIDIRENSWPGLGRSSHARIGHARMTIGHTGAVLADRDDHVNGVPDGVEGVPGPDAALEP